MGRESGVGSRGYVYTTLHCLLIIYFSGIKLYLVRLGNCFKVPGCKRDGWIRAGLIGQFSQLIRSVSEFSELVSSVQSARLVTLSS